MSSIHTCWSCRGPAPDDLLCPTCGAIQPPDPSQDFFYLFSLPLSFEVDVAVLESRYREAQQRSHPDRYAMRTAVELRFSMEWATRLNEAYHTLQDPLARAGYLLQLFGKKTGDRDGAASTDPEFLMEVMAQREELASINPKATDATMQLDAMRAATDQRIAEEEKRLRNTFRSYFENKASDLLDRAATYMDRFRYHRRFLEELVRLETCIYAE